jgi:hypothetical protein
MIHFFPFFIITVIFNQGSNEGRGPDLRAKICGAGQEALLQTQYEIELIAHHNTTHVDSKNTISSSGQAITGIAGHDSL